MPRLTRLRVGALERLASELRFAPRQRIISMVRAAEKIAARLDPDDLIDERDLVRDLTGYRPDADDPASIPGNALLADLSALCERLADAAEISADELPGSVTAEDVAERWNLSVKTVSRYRREGLIAWRVRSSDNAVTLRFTPEAVEAFERARNLRKKANERPQHLTPEETTRLARLARRAQRRFHWSRTETAQRLAQRSGRAYTTIRRALTKELGRPIPKATARKRRDAYARWRRGEPTKDIAQAIARTPETARRWIDRQRRENLLALELPAAEPPIDESALDTPLAQTNLLITPPLRASDFVERARTAPPADPAALRTLDRARTALLLRARAFAQEEGKADDAETSLRWARILSRRLADLHTRLTLDAIETAIGGPLLQLAPPLIRALHREAMRAAFEGIARHDARSGGSVSAAINLALTRRLARAPETSAARRALAGSANRAESPTAQLDDWTARPSRWDDPFAALRAGAAEDHTLRAWIAARAGLTGERPLTRAEAAAALDITTARAARLDRAARALAG